MEKKGVIWLIIILLVVASAYIIPYTLLSEVDAWYGSFLFWIVFALVSIVINVAIALRWRD